MRVSPPQGKNTREVLSPHDDACLLPLLSHATILSPLEWFSVACSRRTHMDERQMAIIRLGHLVMMRWLSQEHVIISNHTHYLSSFTKRVLMGLWNMKSIWCALITLLKPCSQCLGSMLTKVIEGTSVTTQSGCGFSFHQSHTFLFALLHA